MVERQRELAERLLIAALREQDIARGALDSGKRARFLAATSLELARSLDELATHDSVARRALPREDSWCMVTIIELDGAVRRLPVRHSNPRMQAEAETFAERALSTSGDGGLALGRVLVVPLVIRGAVLGAITFVTRDGDPPLSPDEVALASDVADLCAIALDNARLYRDAQVHREAAETANRAKSTFLSTMSHELLTPLNAIGGYVALMEMGLRGPVTAEQQADLARIAANQAHLLTLISDVLALARTEAGTLQYRFTEISVSAIVREVEAMLQSLVDERRLALVCHVGSADAVVWADADRVRQILMNLMSNAIKYGTTAGGQITLEWNGTPSMAAIHVIDDGPGIPADRLDAIFDPFVQLPNALSDRRGGVGLGLAISRDLARAMNGDLTVSSAIGMGARFTLELPRAPSSGRAAP